MKWRGAFVAALAITIVYVVALVWLDASRHVFAELPRLLKALPTVLALSFCSYLVRYARWSWLLRRAGQGPGSMRGQLAYLSGFAFTATPGKVGELVRVRYCGAQGVPSHVVLAAFLYERALDVVVVLALASLVVLRSDLLVTAAVFVAVCIAALVVVARSSSLAHVAALLRARRFDRIARLCELLRDGLVHGRVWMNARDLGVSLVLGLAAWSITAGSFVWLLGELGIVVPLRPAIAIYPLALLAGAASMLPGGIGSTEVVIVALLGLFDVPLDQAALAAIGIRLASLWFAIACGFVAIAILELAPPRGGPVRPPIDARSLRAPGAPTRRR